MYFSISSTQCQTNPYIIEYLLTQLKTLSSLRTSYHITKPNNPTIKILLLLLLNNHSNPPIIIPLLPQNTPPTTKHWFQGSRPTRRGTVRQQSTPANRDHLYPDSLLFVSAGFLLAELIRNSTTKPLCRRPDRTQFLLLLIAGVMHPNPGPTA